jgi:hypothetical protein
VFFFPQFIGIVIDDSNASKEDKHKVDIKLGKQPKVE